MVHQRPIKRRVKRRSKRQKQQKRTAYVIGTGLLVVVLVASFFMHRVLKVSPSPVEDQEETFEADVQQPLGPRLVPLFDIAEAYLPRGTFTAPTTRPLPDSILLMPGIDINFDGLTEDIVASLVTETITPDRNLRNSDYNTFINSLIVRKDDRVVLRVDEYAIRDHNNRRLVNQVPALYGYAFRTSEYYDEFSPFDGPVTLIHLVILDGIGRGASDEITLYWNPARNSFAATNTFGAPGTY